MSPDQRLRAYAIGDLQRFCKPNHYWMRDHDIEADRQLTEPLIARYASLGLTVRELDAANALHALAIYEIRYRAIFSVAYPVRDIDDAKEIVGTTPAQDIEIAARYEMYRKAALAYARTLNDAQLIEAYQPAVQKVSTHTPNVWEIPERLEHIARQLGEEWMTKQKIKPGVIAIAKYLETELKNRNLTGPRGDYWDWGTIKKQALTGITGRKANGKK
jgi:hypothetical protein